ncbi:endoplasmic oxidoreductin [Sparassis latifolia]
MLPRHLCALLLGFLVDHVRVAQSQSFLDNNILTHDQVQNVLEHKPANEPSCQQFPTGPIDTTLCDYETIESVNDELYTQLHELVETPFFKYFRADLYRECPFWQENGLCVNRECGITTVDESEIPERWRAAALSKLEVPPDPKYLPGCYYRDSDYCFLDDVTEGDYIDLTLNPERFTGYVGPSAHRVWSSIYQENCFGISSSSSADGDALKVDDAESPKECLEQRVYYKIISGLHASITTHICRDTLNQTTGEWGPDLQCFIDRVAIHPERLQYIYFDAVLLLRAVARLGPYLSAYDYCATETREDDMDTLERLNKVITIAQAVGKFDETALFRGENANTLKEEFKDHFRNVTRIMDCVGCDKCRLWGKVQTTGLATALKVLFELDEKALDPQTNTNLLQRSEVVALINTLHRFAESLASVHDFRQMWAETHHETQPEVITASRGAAKPHRSPAAGADALQDAQYFLEELLGRVACWVRACKKGTVGCVQGLLDGARSVLETLESMFQVSGKDQVPRSDL